MHSRKYRCSCARWLSRLVGFTTGLCCVVGLSMTFQLVNIWIEQICDVHVDDTWDDNPSSFLRLVSRRLKIVLVQFCCFSYRIAYILTLIYSGETFLLQYTLLWNCQL